MQHLFNSVGRLIPSLDLQSYNVYYGTQTRNYGPPIPVENDTSFTLSGLDEGATYFFAVSAVDTSGNESGYSEEVTKSIPFTDNPYQLLWSPNDRSNPTSLGQCDHLRRRLYFSFT